MLLIFDRTRYAGIIKPIKPINTATCIMCILRLSFALPIAENNAISSPNAAGINAVGLACPILNP